MSLTSEPTAVPVRSVANLSPGPDSDHPEDPPSTGQSVRNASIDRWLGGAYQPEGPFGGRWHRDLRRAASTVHEC